MSHPTLRSFRLRPLAAAAALLAVTAQAAVTPSGLTSAWPGNAPIGPGDTDLGNVGLFVGSDGVGGLQVDAGSLLRTGALLLGPSGNGNGDGTVLFTGLGTRVELTGDGFSDGVVNRLGVGEWGRGLLTVADGAVLDGRANAAACLGEFHYCNNFIGNAAGSDGTLVVRGAGSQASFLRGFYVGGVAVFHPPVDAFTFGTPGGTTQGRVQVLEGADLVTEGATLGLAPGGGSPTGTERSFADVVIRGSASVWTVTEGVLEARDAFFTMASHRNAWATTTIDQGGVLQVEGSDARFSSVNVGSGGRADMVVRGPGSTIHFTQRNGLLQVGRAAGGTGTLDIVEAGSVTGATYAAAGRNGGFGTLTVDGTGSLLRLDRTFTAAANGNSGAPFLEIGRNGGNGTVNVRNGGRIEMVHAATATNGFGINLGRDAASAGTLNIVGGTVVMTATSVAPGTADETLNPFVRVGRDGQGTLNISGGGKLLLEGGAVSTVDHRRSTNVYIGGNGDSTPGGNGIATVSGSGSEIRLSGTDTFIGVGIGPSSTGQLTVRQQGQVSAIGMSVGRAGGVGVLTGDAGVLSFSGQQTAGSLVGAFFTVGTGTGGVGVATLGNGSVMTLSNPGTAGAGLSLGGSLNYAGGDGSLTLSGGSRIEVVAAPGLAVATIGREGTGLLRMRDASALDLGDGKLYVGRFAGSDGTVVATGGSTIDAGWVGVGRYLDTTTGMHFDGGTGTMVLNGATLNATDVVIGTNGYLGGSAGAINVSGTLLNYGIFSPGSSPGVFTVNGAFSAGAGSRLILEVQADGAGGFDIDTLQFAHGAPVDLGSLLVEFRFLGDTDPNAFQASGRFDIDSFVQQADAGGAFAGLDDVAFAQVGFAARADAYRFESFDFSAAGGAVFTAVPVPEPATWALWGVGLLALARRSARRSSSAA